MFQILVQKGYSWRQLFLCWAAIKDNISYLSKKEKKEETWQDDRNSKTAPTCSQRPPYVNIKLNNSGISTYSNYKLTET